ncbi:helix-turn-helix domain-containing protein [Actinomycetospora lemnae]|uniref:Helix-turn-helix domain-containing protein n=1 Tax=Actinomycetospora lemnae TaxID=3019891 RepID=A0ABT5SSD8_9PSEU|nr:helix-turn-helix domain-containing protein [Actinomycetospora sp. DW7H6]MDD7965753.1 helix-turn-helix domain-containing protein [Actinomycetospora sp. DW7H6]
MGLSSRVVGGADGPVERVWVAACDEPVDFSSLASARGGLGFVRVGGVTRAHLRGPIARASTLSSPRGAEYFGADFRVGAFLPSCPPARLADHRDAVLPILPDGRVVLGGQAWEMPTPQNVDVFVRHLERVGVLVVDPLVERLWQEDRPRSVPVRTAQSRFARAVGLSRRTVRAIEQARDAARLLSGGGEIADVATAAGYYDQPHLTRSLRAFIGHTPAEIARGEAFLAL